MSTPPAPRQKSLRQRMMESGADYALRYFDDEPAARAALRLVDDHTMTSYERMITLWQQVRYVDQARVPGALVECGTWRGGAVGMMALAHLAHGPAQREIHLFDSFEGLPEPDRAVDGEASITYASGHADARLETIGQCVGPLEDNQQLLGDIVQYPRALTHYHVGWFQDTVPAAAAQIGPIAVLRLDGDWYDSTKVCLEALYGQVSPGGVVVLDDYGKWPGCRRAVDEFLRTLPRPPFINHIDGAGRYLLVP